MAVASRRPLLNDSHTRLSGRLAKCPSGRKIKHLSYLIDRPPSTYKVQRISPESEHQSIETAMDSHHHSSYCEKS